jgi:hypothetical protein
VAGEAEIREWVRGLLNEVLGRDGAFWQREYYDRLIRNGVELGRAVRYVVNNPERVGLKGWKWVGARARKTARQPVSHHCEHKSLAGDPGLETGATGGLGSRIFRSENPELGHPYAPACSEDRRSKMRCNRGMRL